MKISLYEAQRLYYENQLTKFRSTLIMLGYKHLELPRLVDPVFVYKKGSYIIQIKPTLPIDIRTWNESTNLQVYNEFSLAIRNILNEDF